jgi:hypothetical protein
MLRAGLAANAWRTVHGRAKLALAPALYFRKFRLVILLIVSLLLHCTNAPPRITFYRRQVCVAGHFKLFPVILEIMKNLTLRPSVPENRARSLRSFTVYTPRPGLLYWPINGLFPLFMPFAKLSGRFSRELFENAIELR